MINNWYESDLGVNSDKLLEVASKYSNSIFVDLGVRRGVSSEILLHNSVENNNFVYGVDVSFSMCSIPTNNLRYTRVLGDSVSVGRKWNNGKIDGLFVDTLHTKEQVMCELKYWWEHLKERSFIAFHDSNWPIGKHEVINGIAYDRVEDAIKSFFGVDQLDYEDDYIHMKTYPESWGMTIVNLKQKKNYISLFENWVEVLNKRNKLISLFWNKENSKHLDLELLLDV